MQLSLQCTATMSCPRMSALGHEQTLERGSGMSALPLKADMLRLPDTMSAKCQKRTRKLGFPYRASRK